SVRWDVAAGAGGGRKCCCPKVSDQPYDRSQILSPDHWRCYGVRAKSRAASAKKRATDSRYRRIDPNCSKVDTDRKTAKTPSPYGNKTMLNTGRDRFGSHFFR